MTQNERVLRHLEDVGELSPVDAMERYGIMRLGARIWDLRREGHRITRTMKSCTNRYGDTVRYASYRMEVVHDERITAPARRLEADAVAIARSKNRNDKAAD